MRSALGRRLAAAAVLLAGAGLGGAGCTGPAESGDATRPGLTATPEGPATTRVQARDIYSTMRLEGTVEAYDVVQVVAARAGDFVPAAGLANGRTVKLGGTIGRIESCPAPAATPAATPAPGAAQCTVVRTAVTAPVAGELSGLYPQPVAAGAAVAGIRPPGFHIKLPVADPALLFSFRTPPKSGKAELVGGPAGFTAAYENLVYAKDTGLVSVYASVPADVPAFAGLHAVVVFITGVRTQVPALPLSAVRGRSGAGQVVTVDAGGRRRPVDVTIGAADDAYVEVTGVDPGADVLLYPLESDFAG